MYKYNSEAGNAQSTYVVAGSILVAGLIIAGSIFFSGQNITPPVGPPQLGNIADHADQPMDNGAGDGRNVPIAEITDDDYILGDRNADIVLVEYSDIECPFCKRHHPTLEQLVQDEGVAWVYRHLPLESIHPNARSAANAAECVGALGGNDAYWDFLDAAFEAPNLTNLSPLAVEVGISEASFNECFDAGTYDHEVDADLQDALGAGGTGTPYTVIVAPDGSNVAVSGALPYASLKSLIDVVRAEAS